MPANFQALTLTNLSRLRRQDVVERYALQLVCFGLLVLSLAGLLYLTQASALVTTMYQIEELQQEKQRLQRERDRLRAEIARHTTPERIKVRAQELGFESPAQVEYLAIEKLPVPVRKPGRGDPIPEGPELRGLSSVPGVLERLLASMATRVEAGVSER